MYNIACHPSLFFICTKCPCTCADRHIHTGSCKIDTNNLRYIATIISCCRTSQFVFLLLKVSGFRILLRSSVAIFVGLALIFIVCLSISSYRCCIRLLLEGIGHPCSTLGTTIFPSNLSIFNERITDLFFYQWILKYDTITGLSGLIVYNVIASCIGLEVNQRFLRIDEIRFVIYSCIGTRQRQVDPSITGIIAATRSTISSINAEELKEVFNAGPNIAGKSRNATNSCFNGRHHLFPIDIQQGRQTKCTKDPGNSFTKSTNDKIAKTT